MKDFHELLISRHSIRKYTAEAISPEDVKLIIEAALMAPSSKRSMPWEFVLIDDKDKLEILSHCREFGSAPLARCSLAILVLSSPAITDTWIEDASIASSYIQLQAEALGLGSCWVQIRGRYTKGDEISAQDYICQHIDIPGDQQILCAITLGHKDETRKPFDLDKLSWEKVHIAK
ncbi:MAG: nitroreductase family protein [Muribaculaceae bacterium]|nr:nitroreductase family protein [Muribaculaceae bacterium]